MRASSPCPLVRVNRLTFSPLWGMPQSWLVILRACAATDGSRTRLAATMNVRRKASMALLRKLMRLSAQLAQTLALANHPRVASLSAVWLNGLKQQGTVGRGREYS